MSLDPKQQPTPEQIEKMLEEARMKTVPPHILQGFKDDVMRRIESERRAKPGRWFGSNFKLPRVGMSVGFGALACLILVSLAVFTVEKPVPTEKSSFQVASLPATAASLSATQTARSFDKMVASPAPTALQAEAAAPVPVPKPSVKKAKLTVEEELRLIEEFDDQKFFIRQDITEDDLASA